MADRIASFLTGKKSAWAVLALALILASLVMGMGQAMDVWLMTRHPDADDLPRLIGVLIEMMRGAVQP